VQSQITALCSGRKVELRDHTRSPRPPYILHHGPSAVISNSLSEKVPLNFNSPLLSPAEVGRKTILVLAVGLFHIAKNLFRASEYTCHPLSEKSHLNH